MKSRLLGISALTVLISLSVTGCANKSIVGKWSGTIPIPGGRGAVNAAVEYKPDGTETTTVSQGGIAAVVNETYTVKDDTITETVTGISMGGRTIPMPGQTPKTQTAHFKLDGDSLTLTRPGSSQSFTMTRVKS